LLELVEPTIPSRTALRVALRRAAHQLYDSPVVFADPIAVPILGPTHAEELERTPLRVDRPYSIALRAFIVARSRYAEDHLFRFVGAGVRQYVLLGAGLDTFAYRNPFPELGVFEVDHPATQEWKRQLLSQSGIPIPESLTYAPVDFERESLRAQLLAAGFDERIPSLFAWLGVVPYLTLDAFRATLGFIASQPPGTGVVLDYGQPRAVLPPLEQLAHDSLAARVEGAGEPFQLFFTPAGIAAELTSFRDIEDIGAAEINARYFKGRSDRLEVRGAAGRLLTAWR
jgi:methyltransferase (TIGR00027 family)